MTVAIIASLRRVPSHILAGVTGFNNRLAQIICKGVGTMSAAYLFCGLALLMLPTALAGGIPTFIPWIAQTFLQLVLLPIIIVGQNLQTKASAEHHELIKDLHGEIIADSPHASQ